MKRFPNRARLGLQQLEAREVPATMVNASTLTYTDVDGDSVKVAFSKGFLNAGNVNSIFTFGTGNVNGSNAAKQQLMVVDLATVAGASGTSITVTATASPTNGGDGLAAIGEIDAAGVNLGAVNVASDLGRILAGNASLATPAIAGLTVQSLGRYGLTTGAQALVSVINGNLSSLTVKSDVKNAEILVNGSLGNVTIGGSLIGGATDMSGEIEVKTSIGSVTVKGDLVGGAGSDSGSILTGSGAAIGAITIGGSIRGGVGSQSGAILAGKFSSVTVTGDVNGGAGDQSGAILSQSTIGNVSIGGSLRGGTGSDSGAIDAASDVGNVTIKGQLEGGGGNTTGIIRSIHGKLGIVKTGSLRGGAGNQSGFIMSGSDMGTVTISGDVIGNAGGNSAEVVCGGKLAGVNISGSLVGSTGNESGLILTNSDTGNVTITGSMVGGSGFDSGAITIGGKIGNLTIGGSILGGSNAGAGFIVVNSDAGQIRVGGDIVQGAQLAGIDVSGKTTSVSVGGSIEGGIVYSKDDTGSITVGGDVTGEIGGNGAASSITIGGSLLGGKIISLGNIGNLTITGDVVGSSASGSTSVVDTGYIQAARIANLTVGGSLVAGVDQTTGQFQNNGAIHVINDIGSVTIKGNIEGNSSNPFLITACGSQNPTATTDTALGTINVSGNVEFATILAGYDLNASGANADAQIGNVTVGGDWIASSMVAGVKPGFGPYFGTVLDQKLSGAGVKDVPTVLSKIGSVSIGGQALGTPGGFDFYGIVAENVVTVKVDNVLIPLHMGAHNDAVALGITGDFSVREV